jgi:hypothetical protein
MMTPHDASLPEVRPHALDPFENEVIHRVW